MPETNDVTAWVSHAEQFLDELHIPSVITTAQNYLKETTDPDVKVRLERLIEQANKITGR